MKTVAAHPHSAGQLYLVAHAGVRTTFCLPSAHVDHIQKHIASTRTFYEQEMLEHMRARVARGALVMDVGACIGNHTLFLAHVCQARVIALEPNGEAFSVLTRNLELNGLTERVDTRQVAAGATTATGTLVPDATGDNLGMTRVDASECGDVRIVRIDDLLIPTGLVVLKIDVEGMELDVLRGAEATLKRDRPLIYVECGERNSLAAVSEFLCALGYSANAQFNATTTVLFRPVPAGAEALNQQLALQHHEVREQLTRARGALGSLLKRTHDEAQASLEKLASSLSRDGATDRQALDSLVSSTALYGEVARRVEQRTQRLPELEELTRESLQVMQGLRADVQRQATQLRQLETQLVDLRRDSARTQQEVARSRREILRSGESPLHRLARKTRKLVQNPDAFFADSQSRFTREHLRRLYASTRPSAQLQVKLAKLNRDPDAFLRDSKHYAMNTLARRLYASFTARATQPPQPVSASPATPDTGLDVRAFDETVFSVVMVGNDLDHADLALLVDLGATLGPTDELVVVTGPAALDRDLPLWSEALSGARARVYAFPAERPPSELTAYGLDRALGAYCVVIEVLSAELIQRVHELKVTRRRADLTVMRTRTSQAIVGMAASRDAWRRARHAVPSADVRTLLKRALTAHADVTYLDVTEPPTQPAAPRPPTRPSRARMDFCPRGREATFCETLVAAGDTSRDWCVFAADAQALRAELDQVNLASQVSVLDADDHPDAMLYAMPALEAPFASSVHQQPKPILCLEKKPATFRAVAAKLRPQRDLVSVVMTLYNAESTVEAAIDSVLHQTYAHLELIVVDDCSEDNSLAVALCKAKHDRRVRVLRAPRNMGTYWCKNLGLLDAKGHYVTFQDADDISLAPRLELQVAALRARPQLLACITGYQRLSVAGEVKWIGEFKDRRARITLMLRRADLGRYGFFDSVRMSADDEMLKRISALGGRVARIPGCYYIARHAEGSLTTSGVGMIEAVHSGAPLPTVRAEYLAAAANWHRQIAGAGAEGLDFPLRRRPFVAPDHIGADRSCEHEVVTASLATMPSRISVLETTLRSLLPQVDRLNIYLNNFEEVPPFLEHEKIHIVRSQDFGDLKDNGKFFFTNHLAPGYHLTVDDDIEYPRDYVRRLILAIERYQRRAVVGLHGVVLDAAMERYTKRRSVLHFKDELVGDRFVTLLGTGTVAYHTSTLSVDHAKYERTGVADLWFAAQARAEGVPLVAIARPQGWLRPLEHDGETIFAATSRDDSAETALARSLGPWTPEAFDRVRQPLVTELSGGLSLRQLRASGFDIHEIARARDLPMVQMVVIVTGWNCADRVRRCWQSIARQRPGHYTRTVIMVDDGSDDQTWQTLCELPMDPTVHIRRHAVNRGPAFSRWEIIREIEDPQTVCVLVDLDDELLPSALASIAEAYLMNEQCWLTTGNWRNQSGRSNPLDFYPEPVVQKRAYRRVPGFRFGHVRSFRRFLAAPLTDEMFKGPDGEWLMFCTDVALMLPLAEQCAPENIECIRDHLYLYNERRESGTLMRFGKPKKREIYGWICRQKPVIPHGSESPTAPV